MNGAGHLGAALAVVVVAYRGGVAPLDSYGAVVLLGSWAVVVVLGGGDLLGS